MTTKNIEIGDIAKDTITGLEGTVIGRIVYLHNSDRLVIQPKGMKDGKAYASDYFDASRVAFISKGHAVPVPVHRPADPVELGDEVEDTITGIRGTVVWRTEWISGCSRLGVQVKDLHDGLPVEAQNTDEAHARILTRVPRPAKNAPPREQPPGGPMPAPKRR